jgi:hypothetical protein
MQMAETTVSGRKQTRDARVPKNNYLKKYLYGN